MRDRLKKIERVLAVQEQLHRLAQWRMAALDREKAENASGQADLLSALNDDNQLHGPVRRGDDPAPDGACRARPSGWSAPAA